MHLLTWEKSCKSQIQSTWIFLIGNKIPKWEGENVYIRWLGHSTLIIKSNFVNVTYRLENSICFMYFLTFSLLFVFIYFSSYVKGNISNLYLILFYEKNQNKDSKQH